MPVVVTEQYPQALGHTVVELRGVLPNNALVVSKTAFTMLGMTTPYSDNYSDRAIIIQLEPQPDLTRLPL